MTNNLLLDQSRGFPGILRKSNKHFDFAHIELISTGMITKNEKESLIPKHGGYRKLKSFQIAQLVYDVPVQFCDRYIERRSRTHDQMACAPKPWRRRVQAARSGVQNIAEGSMASGTSKKTELKLTNVVRASLEELRLDYEDYLRQRDLPEFKPEHPALKRFKERQCASLNTVRIWVAEEVRRAQADTDKQRRTRTDTDEEKREQKSMLVSESLCASVFAANAALSLLNLCCFFLDRQLAVQAKAFEKEGGFTERLYRVRSQIRASS